VPIIRAKNHVEEYAARAMYFPSASMAARSSDEASVSVARNIIGWVGTPPEGILVDVGCGDGSLLHLLQGDRVGIAPSEEEVTKLRRLWPDVRFMVALAQALLLPDNSVSMLFCNSMLLTLETAKEARKAIGEFSRVCRSGASVFWVKSQPSFRAASTGTIL
jgi:ubiquinone/menaquinone biosynthesis C-methylase UbiE